MTQRFTIAFAALFALLALALAPGAASAAAVYQNGEGVAIDGTDPVAYFKEGKPVEGDPAHSLEWNGATWHFASAENKMAFEAEPEKYAPQYGGYCAWAVSQGYSASTVPEAWSIENGRLFLNYSKGVQSKWEADKAGHIESADANWPKVKEDLGE